MEPWMNDLPTKIFVGCLVVLLSIANVLMGCELDLNVVWRTVRNPIAPAIGFFTQFFLMPILSYMIANLVLVKHGQYAMALGLFVTGCSPAGSASNFWTLLLEGNAHLSVTMTFFSMIAALFMMPFWMKLLGHQFLVEGSKDTIVRVPYSKIVSSLGGLLAPLLIGIAIARFRPNWAAKARKVLRPFVVFVLVFLIVFGIICNLDMFKHLNFPAVIAGLLLPWCGFMFGCFTSILLRQKPEDVTAIAIETGVQNTGIAIMVLQLSFGEHEAVISTLLPVLVACFTPAPLLLGFGVHRAIKYMRARRSYRQTEASDIKEAHRLGTLERGVGPSSQQLLVKSGPPEDSESSIYEETTIPHVVVPSS